MAPTIIYFIKQGSKIKLPSGKTVTADHSRLHVGYCLRDWCKVFYEPTDTGDIDDDVVAVPASYRYFTAKKSNQTTRREPTEGEIAFLPHFDPKHIHNNDKKQKKDAHKQFLHDAWRFLNADDEDVQELISDLTDVNHRRWQSWFDEAIQWKLGHPTKRTKRRNYRAEGLVRAGIDPKDVAGLSDTSDDSAYQTDNEADAPVPMGPPTGRGMRPNARAFPGNGAGANSTTRRRPGQSPHDSSSGSALSAIGRRRPAPKPRGRPARRGFPTLPFGEESDNEGDVVMSGGSGGTPRPGPSPRGGLLRTRSPSSARSCNGSLNGVERLSSSVFDTRAPEDDPPQPRGPEQDAWMAEYQGGYDEYEAMQQAVRASLAPESHQAVNGASQDALRAIVGSELQGVLPTPQATGNAAVQAAEDDDPYLAEALEANSTMENRLPQPRTEDDREVDVD